MARSCNNFVMPELIEVALMAALCRVLVVGRALHVMKKVFVDAKDWLSKKEQKHFIARVVTFVYAMEKTIIFTFEGTNKVLQYAPMQYGFLTVVPRSLYDTCPLYRARKYCNLHMENNTEQEKQSKANIGFALQFKIPNDDI